jgi:hypothetical protein
MTANIRSLLLIMLSITGAVAMPATSNAASSAAKAGDVFEILLSYETRSEENGENSGSSSGHTTILERVLRFEENGVELEYEEPLEKDGRDKRGTWQLPVRIFRPFAGEPSLLNIAELEARVDPWLKKRKMPREACGHWYFTWNAFKIECDPASALGIVRQYDLWPANLSEGQLYHDADALAPMPLHLRDSDETGSTYAVELVIDPDKVKQAQAESAVVVAKIFGESKSPEDALNEQADHKISGTISVIIETNRDGLIMKRSQMMVVRIEKPDGETESRVSSRTVERQLYAGTKNPDPQ